MALSASYPPDTATIMSGDIAGPGDFKDGSQSLDFDGEYESNIQDGTAKAANYESNQTVESNSASSSPMTHKESASTDGDGSDTRGRGSSENGTDITVPDGEQVDAKTKIPDKKMEKKRMKRFRLTHNQTRYLMSEFTRQAHPDAAHRERLSREIPGLSPRQVQVWFQNRRAKLKRLTSDDRERMLRSRALPDDFDMAQALHSPYGNCPHPSSTPATSSAGYCPPGLVPTSPIFANGFKGYNDEYVTSPLSATSPWNSYFPPHQIHPSRREASPNQPPRPSSPGQTNPYLRSGSFPNPSQPLHSPLHHLQFGEPPTGRPRTVSLGAYPNGSYTSAPLHRSGPITHTDAAKEGDSPFGAPSSPNSVSATSAKRNDQAFEQQEARSSPRTPATTSLLPSALQLKTGEKDLKPAVQSAPLSLSNGCEASPLSPHFSASPFGVTYAQNMMSTMSLPASPFYFNHNGKNSDEYDPFDNISHGLPDPLIEGRQYAPSFQFAGAQ